MTTQRCCDDYSCAEIYPAKCIKYTGPQPVTQILYKEFQNCNPSMEEVTKVYDSYLSDILAKNGVDAAALKVVNDTCGLNLVNLSTLNTYTYNDKKYVEGEVIIQLVSALCSVSKRLNYLMNESQTATTDLFWLDLPLKGKLDFTKALCLTDPDCFAKGEPETLGQLLQAIINKICP